MKKIRSVMITMPRNVRQTEKDIRKQNAHLYGVACSCKWLPGMKAHTNASLTGCKYAATRKYLVHSLGEVGTESQTPLLPTRSTQSDYMNHVGNNRRHRKFLTIVETFGKTSRTPTISANCHWRPLIAYTCRTWNAVPLNVYSISTYISSSEPFWDIPVTTRLCRTMKT